MSNTQPAKADAESLAMRVLRAIRRLAGFRLARIHWAAEEDARREGRWAKMAKELEAMHASHWMNDESHSWLGVAHTNCEQFEEAVQQFELIAGRLDDEPPRVCRRLWAAPGLPACKILIGEATATNSYARR